MKTPQFSLCLLLGVALVAGLTPPLASAGEATPAPKATAEAALAGPPKTLAIEVTVLRVKPDTKERVLEDYALSGSASNAIEQLKATVKSVDVLCRVTREVLLEDKAKAVFDALESRPVIALGGSGTPTVTPYGLKLETTVRSVAGDRFALSWEGTLTWSPDIMDRRAGFNDTLRFAGKAMGAAQQVTKLAGAENSEVRQVTEIGLALAQAFGGDKSQIYELPVLKTFGLSGSRACKSGELVTCTTSADAGAKEPQTILLLIRPVVKE